MYIIKQHSCVVSHVFKEICRPPAISRQSVHSGLPQVVQQKSTRRQPGSETHQTSGPSAQTKQPHFKQSQRLRQLSRLAGHTGHSGGLRVYPTATAAVTRSSLLTGGHDRGHGLRPTSIVATRETHIIAADRHMLHAGRSAVMPAVGRRARRNSACTTDVCPCVDVHVAVRITDPR